jgi:hypothetical protein
MTASVVQWSEFLAADLDVRIRFPALPDFLRSIGSGTGSTQPCDYNWEATRMKSSGSGLEMREYRHRYPSLWPRSIIYPHKLALTSPTTGGRSVDIVRSRTQVTMFVFFIGNNVFYESGIRQIYAVRFLCVWRVFAQPRSELMLYASSRLDGRNVRLFPIRDRRKKHLTIRMLLSFAVVLRFLT